MLASKCCPVCTITSRTPARAVSARDTVAALMNCGRAPTTESTFRGGPAAVPSGVSLSTVSATDGSATYSIVSSKEAKDAARGAPDDRVECDPTRPARHAQASEGQRAARGRTLPVCALVMQTLAQEFAFATRSVRIRGAGAQKPGGGDRAGGRPLSCPSPSPALL